jgi:hypothetical protein
MTKNMASGLTSFGTAFTQASIVCVLVLADFLFKLQIKLNLALSIALAGQQLGTIYGLSWSTA